MCVLLVYKPGNMRSFHVIYVFINKQYYMVLGMLWSEGTNKCFV